MRREIRKGQSVSEYVILLAIVGMAFIGMQVYMKRGIQAGVKAAADELGPQENAQALLNFQRQEKTSSITDTSRRADIQTQTFSGGSVRRDTDDTVSSTSTSHFESTER